MAISNESKQAIKAEIEIQKNLKYPIVDRIRKLNEELDKLTIERTVIQAKIDALQADIK